MAVGDIMMHQDVKRSGLASEGGFSSLWKEVEPLLRGADLTFGNLETPVAPHTGGAGRPFCFNAPADLVPALRASGFQLLSTANNHTYDQGRKGVAETLEHLREAGLAALGSGQDREHAEAPLLLERQGIRFAFFGATDIFNTNLNQEGQGPWVAALDPDRLELAIRKVRPQVDAVVVSLHWGIEYHHNPSVRQQDIARRLVGAGADLILGHHPHVLEPLAWIEASGRRGAVIYSLGNFISNQDRSYDPGHMAVKAGDSRDGAALVATWVKETGGVRLDSVVMEPLWTDNRGTEGHREIRVEYLGERSDALAQLRRSRILAVLDGQAGPDALPPKRSAQQKVRPRSIPRPAVPQVPEALPDPPMADSPAIAAESPS